MATATANGGDEQRSGAVRESEGEEGMSMGESGRGSRGVRVALGCLQRRAGKQEVAGVCSRVATTRPSSSWQGEEDDRGGGDGPGWPAGWAGLSPGPGKPGEVFSLFVILFYFCNLF